MTLSNMPAGWALLDGMQLADGSWTVQTGDVRSRAIVSPSNFAGAAVVNVTESWTQTDGTTATLIVNDNVEAYAPGSPIFA